MGAITRITEDGTIRIVSPYNSEFIKAAKMIQGKWNSEKKSWDFPIGNEEQLDKILIENYGECGKCEETLNVIINLYEIGENAGEGIVLNGLILASRRSRDVPVRINENAVLISGGFPESGGSTRYPRCNPLEDTKVKITVSREWYENNKDNECIEQVVNSESIDKSRLIEEKERLLARVAEIEKQLSE